MTAQLTQSPVAYPSATVGDNVFQFRYTKSSKMLLEMWGIDFTRPIPIMILAACMAGSVIAGIWRSVGFTKPTEFTDLIGIEDDDTAIHAAVNEALKKAFPTASIAVTAKSGMGDEKQPESGKTNGLPNSPMPQVGPTASA
jgi:hypothetical protein